MSSSSSRDVSVIVPAYQAEDTIGACLDSVLSQTRPVSEIIVVDDGSTDGTRAVMEEYAQRHPLLVLLSQENSGPGVARNRALKQAHGDYVLFLDSDDWIEPTLVEKAVDRAEQTAADIVVWDTWFENVRTGKACLSTVVRLDRCEPDGFSWRDDPDHVFQSFQNWPWNKLFRREFLVRNEIAFAPLMRTEDLLFTGKALMRANKVVAVPEALSHYRMSQESSAMSVRDPYAFDFYYAFKQLREWLDAEGVFPFVQKSYLNWAFSGCVVNMIALRTWSAFDEVYRFLVKEGFAALGFSLDEEGIFLDSGQRDEYRFMMGHDSSEYLRFALSRSERERDEQMVLAGSRWWELHLLEDRLRGLESENKRLADENAQHRDHIGELQREHQALEEHHSAIMNAAEQRIGQALCRIPRMIQRRMLRRR